MANTAATEPHEALDGVHVDAADAAQGAAAHGGELSFPPFDASLFPSQLIWFALTFAALYYIVARYILPQISGVLVKRATAISGDLDAAAQKSAAAEQARAEMEKATAKARAEARAMVEAARADVMAKLAAEQEAAEARLVERIDQAEARVDAARQAALKDVPRLAEALARDIVDKLAPAGAPAPRQKVAGEV